MQENTRVKTSLSEGFHSAHLGYGCALSHIHQKLCRAPAHHILDELCICLVCSQQIVYLVCAVFHDKSANP